MSYLPLKVQAGVDTVSTPMLAEAKWVASTNIRFFQGKIQQNGFFQRLTSNIPRGVCRGIFPWADTTGNQYIAEGTTQELAVINNGNIYDITPVIATSNLGTPMTTVASSTTVTIADVASEAIEGNWVNINTATSISNLLIQGPFQIQTVGVNEFTITVPSAPSGSVASGGLTALFTTTSASSDILVTLANHGLSVGDIYTVHVSTTVATIVIYGMYVVTSVVDASNFHITGSSNAGSSTTGRENGGNVQVQYLLASGLASTGGTSGYGQMSYGLGPYGLGQFDAYLPLRQWSFGAWGSFLMASPTNGAIYVWMPSGGFFSNPATAIGSAPALNTVIFIAMAQQQIVALGAQDSVTGDQDPMLVRWCNVADYTDWTASVSNQAGSFRLPKGSRIIGGTQTSLQGLIWTDLALWSMQYIQPPLVYGFTQISDGCGLIAARAYGILANAVIWMGIKGFFLYAGGTVTPIPCPLWDTIFNNLDLQQVDKITCAPNSSFTEVSWHIPSASGDGENDTNIKVNLLDGSWDYSNGDDAAVYIRTAWTDQSIIGPPMGVDLNSILQQAETGSQADTNPLVSSARTGWFKLQEGLLIMSIERVIPDFVINGSPTLTISIFTVNYPDDTPVEYGPFTVTSATQYIIVRARARLAALQIDCSSTSGAFWRLGECLIKTYQTGRR